MKRYHRLLACALVLLLAACVIAAYVTRQTGANPAPKSAAVLSAQVDQRLIQTADRVSALADMSDEQALGRDAVQLADHEVDQAFASALRDAGQPSAPRSGPLKALADRVSKWSAEVAADKDRVSRLSKTTPANGSSAANQLELAKAQLALAQDELADAQQDLARQGGDQEADLQRAFEQYEAAQAAAATQKTPAPPPTNTLSDQVRAWLSLRDRKQQVDLAGAAAKAHAATLRKAHDALEALAAHKPPAASATDTAATPASGDSADSDQEDVAALIASLEHLSDQKKSMADLDERIEDSQHLAEVYARWDSLLGTRQRGVLHLLLNSLAMVLAIVLAVVLADGLIRKLLRHAQPRRVHHLRLISTVAVQLIGAALIVLIIFGPPNQLSTIIGLATAGLTVALRDFIVAFFGWFALMGRNGIRVGDWVEIRGVSGEVVEIGILKTIVLEMGNWGSTGSPTGRRVAFVNSFAIEDHYFNFSTAGQWLWDELQISLPSNADPYQLSQRIRELVERVTEPDAREAEEDWKRATRDKAAQPFSAKPMVDLRPSAGGLDVVVRYITHAPKRYEVKSRLLQEVVGLVHKTVAEPVREASTSV
ncbi:MAG TPA: mechanosensitive ion channel family protein [Bryobacteraceae bacterium]|nr:mechanosensitive ion channel family protein [Bryobacteraceae bacterium]